MPDQLTFDSNTAQNQIRLLSNGAESWGRTKVRDRLKVVRRIRQVISKRADNIAKAISEECRRPQAETLTQEVLASLEMSRYCEKMSPRWFSPQNNRYLRPGFIEKNNITYWKPLGLVAVITPANWPFSLGMMSLVYLLSAGNTVVIKTSEMSNKVSPIIAEILHDAEVPEDVASVMFGGPEAGKMLINDPTVKKIFFFGKKNNGKEIAAVCNSIGKPYVLELGGGTTAIVCNDAKLDIAARGIAWSGCYANGESCISTNRVVVEENIADRFMEKLKHHIENVKQSDSDDGFIGPIGEFTQQDVDLQKELIEDAISKGADLICGGDILTGKNGMFKVQPVLMTGVTSSMRAWHEESFGPFICIKVVKNAESAIDDLQGDMSPLGVSIWSRNIRRAKSIAYELPVVSIWINDTSIGLPCLPWGGCGPTGKGSMFSKFSLYEVAELRTISIHPNVVNTPRMWWYPYTALKLKLFRNVARRFI